MTGSRAIRLLLVIVVCLIASTETDRLIADTLTTQGVTFSLSDATGVLAFTKVEAWAGWAGSEWMMRPFVLVYCAISALLWVVVGRLLRDLFTATVPGWQPNGMAARVLLRMAVVLQLIGLALVASAFVVGLPGTTQFGYLLATVFTASWAAFLASIIGALRNGPVRASLVAGANRIRHALYSQRLSATVVIGIAVLAIVPRSGVLEQLPDAQRAWIDNGNEYLHAVLAFATTAIVAGILFVLGRKRAERHHRSFVSQDMPTLPASIWWWLSGPILAFAVYLALTIYGANQGDAALFVDHRQFWIFEGILVAILLVSLLLRALDIGSDPLPAPPFSIERAQDSAAAGDLLAFSLVAVSGLSLLRSFTAPLLLSSVEGVGSLGYTILFFVLCGAGTGIGLLAIPALTARAAALNTYLYTTRAAAGPSSHVGRLLLPDVHIPDAEIRWRLRFTIPTFVIAGLTLLMFTVFPERFATFLGPASTAILALGAWSTVLGIGIAEMQDTKPLHIFRAMNLRSNPVLTLLVVVPLLISLIAGSAPTHAIQERPNVVTESKRLSLTQAFQQWYGSSEQCTRETSNGVSVRPLVVAAAEGGGIRAATWTVDVYSQLAVAGDCARSAVLLSSGASGGSVGLTLFREKPSSPDDATATSSQTAQYGVAVDRVTDLGSSAALATVTASLVVGDMIAGSTGLRIPTERNEYSLETPGAEATSLEWQDRAALMQGVWRKQSPNLGLPYDLNRQSPTGWLVLNSTSVDLDCKVLVSQLDLGLPHTTTNTGIGDVSDCRNGTAELPAALDLVEVYRDCPINLDWATAAMLSARFPFVTPAGRVSSETAGSGEAACVDGVPNLQLIDGGYYDNTGLGTISDLAPELASIISAHNALATDRGEAIVVPVVLYVRNSAGADIDVAPPHIQSELVVPLVGVSSNKLQLEASTWLQRISNSFASVCPLDPNVAGGVAPKAPEATPCQVAVSEVRDQLGYGVAIVAPNTSPSLEAPLGWQLSDMSRDILCDKVAAQLDGTARDPSHKYSYGSLPEMVSILEPGLSAAQIKASPIICR